MGNILCPSHKCTKGSRLLGIREADGSISMLKKPLEIDGSFIENFRKNGDEPEQQFRFTNKCMKSCCSQWSGEQCTVASRLSETTGNVIKVEQLPDCPIRSDCRWHKQEGDKICFICPNIITSITEKEINEYFNNILQV